MTRQQVRWILRSFSLLLALGMAWSSRFALDPDGMSYVDVARCYLRGDWHNALSSYWSPLYPWLLTLAFGAFRPGPELLIQTTHAVCLVIFVGVLFAWEWLTREWEASYGPPTHWVLTDIGGYMLITWTGLQLAGVDFSSADDAVIGFLVAVAALLVRIRRGQPRPLDFLLLGVCLAFGFFSKAAFQMAVPGVFAVLFIWRVPIRSMLLTAAGALVCVLPFVVPMSMAKGKLTVSDTGRLNYAWQVTGYSVEGYKEEGYPPPPDIPHPIDRLLDYPRVIGFGKHLVGTTPVHFDPVWWCEGYKAAPNWPRQWMVLRDNVPEMFEEFSDSPALWFALIVFPFDFRNVWGRIGRYWVLWLPAATIMAAYCLVFVLIRYTSAPFTLFGFTLIAAGWNVRLPRWALRVGVPLLLVLSCYSVWTEIEGGVWASVQELAGKRTPDDAYMIDAYQRMKREGFRPGHRAGIIGLTLSVQFLQLLEGLEVAAVPARIFHHDDEIGRPQDFTFETPDAFWKARPVDQSRALQAMRNAGAQWVFASQVPDWANVDGWTPVTPEKDLRDDGNKLTMYFKALH